MSFFTDILFYTRRFFMEQNLSLYYVFHTVAKKGSISHAAKELYISQPAISKSIQKLEDNLNTTLFKRSSRGVTLTADGEILFQHTRDAFDALEAGEEILARHHALGVDQLRIGVSTTLCKYILLPHLQRFIKAYPHVKISISCQSTYQTLTLLEENKIDIGLVGEPAIQKGFYFQPLQKIQDIFVTTTAYLEHLELRSGNSDLFQTATFMMLDEENITRQYINRVFLEHGVELSNILEVSTMDLLIEFAKIGMGVACVIQEFVQEELDCGDLITLPLGLTFPPRQIGFACRKNEQANPVIQHFLDSRENSFL